MHGTIVPSADFESNNQSGYFLIELSIVIMVVGLLLSLTYPFFNLYQYRNAEFITQKKIDFISRALSTYAQTRWRIPCPANSKLIDKQQNGVERSSCDVDVSDAYGIVPYRTLGIPKHYITDGYGNFFTYVVSPNFTADNRLGVQDDVVNARLAHLVGGEEASNEGGDFALLPQAHFCAPLKNDGTDIIINRDGVSLFSKSKRNVENISRAINPNPNLNKDNPLTTVVVALVSHGANKKGAYQLDGSQYSSAPAETAEEITSNNNNRIIKILSKKQLANEEKYDDTVVFYTQDDLYALSDSSCKYL